MVFVAHTWSSIDSLFPLMHVGLVSLPLALSLCVQGALKLKEMAYIHAEGYSGGALKHGPFALIEGAEGSNGATPIILIILDDEHAHQVRGTSTPKCKAMHSSGVGLREFFTGTIFAGLKLHPKQKCFALENLGGEGV